MMERTDDESDKSLYLKSNTSNVHYLEKINNIIGENNYIEYSDPNTVLIESKTGFILRTKFIRMCKQRDIERNNENKNEDIELQFYLELDS
jgi:flagellar basal body P-ring protein FlgI